MDTIPKTHTNVKATAPPFWTPDKWNTDDDIILKRLLDKINLNIIKFRDLESWIIEKNNIHPMTVKLYVELMLMNCATMELRGDFSKQRDHIMNRLHGIRFHINKKNIEHDSIVNI